MKANYLNMLGLAARARKIATGEELIIKEIQTNRAKLVLLANDISERSKKTLTNKCNYYKVPYIEVDDRYTLGNAISKGERVAIAIADQGFAKKIQSLLL